jgi:hypothetical protein
VLSDVILILLSKDRDDAMTTPRQIAAYFDALSNVGEFEILSQILTGIHRYVRHRRAIRLSRDFLFRAAQVFCAQDRRISSVIP